MANTTFISRVTTVARAWLQDVNDFVYRGYLPLGVGAVLRMIHDKLREQVTAADFGAVGDGVTNDTAALQAFFTYVTTNGAYGRIAPKTYLITAPLQIGATTPVPPIFGASGWTIDGGNPLVVVPMGTWIKLSGTGHAAIVQFNEGASRYGTMKGINFSCVTAPAADVYAAEHGIKFVSTFFTGFQFEDMGFGGVRNVIGVYASGGSANGEFNTYTRVNAGRHQKFFVMGAGTGQAFNHQFYSCGGNPQLSQGSPDYVAFDIGGTEGGYGLHVEQFNWSVTNNTSTVPLSMPPCILLRNGGSTSPITFDGGRCEGMTTILDNQDATFGSLVTFKNMDFASMVSSTAQPLVKSSTTGQGSMHFFERCQIPIAGDTDGSFCIDLNTADGSKYIFKDCLVGAYNQATSVPLIISPARKGNSEIRFENCMYRQKSSGQDGTWLLLNRSYKGLAAETAISASWDNYNNPISGRPENLLQYPHFNAAAPIAPWTATGGPFTSYQSAPNVGPNAFSSSPQARSFAMPIGMEVYQDWVAITADAQFAYYVASLLVSVGNTADKLEISLENSTTGELYDKVIIGSAVSTPFSMQTIRLAARSTQNGGSFRLKWKAPSTNVNPLTIKLGWQLCAQRPNPTYVTPPAGATKVFAHDWTTADLLRINGRLALPYKDDATGSAATAATMANLESDVYLSNVTERVKYYANGLWWTIPRATILAAAPVAGTWAVGDQVWNSAPAAGGIPGWICVTAGTPGTWKAMAVLAA